MVDKIRVSANDIITSKNVNYSGYIITDDFAVHGSISKAYDFSHSIFEGKVSIKADINVFDLNCENTTFLEHVIIIASYQLNLNFKKAIFKKGLQIFSQHTIE